MRSGGQYRDVRREAREWSERIEGYLEDGLQEVLALWLLLILEDVLDDDSEGLCFLGMLFVFLDFFQKEVDEMEEVGSDLVGEDLGEEGEEVDLELEVEGIGGESLHGEMQVLGVFEEAGEELVTEVEGVTRAKIRGDWSYF